MWCTVMGTSIVLGYCLIASTGNGIAILLALVVCLLMILLGSPILFNKCILSVLNNKLDTDTYLAVVYQGKFDTPAAIWQLLGEYFCGNYQNVIGICKKMLSDRKTARRYTYHYLTYLANVYFDIGDDESLRRACEQYEIALATEKPSKQAKCRMRFPRMDFYDLYLKQNMEACLVWINKPTPAPINQHHRTFCQARLALLQGNTEEARGYYETLVQTVPQLNYGKLAAEALAKMENQEENQDLLKLTKIAEVTDEASEVTLYPANRRKLRKILGICLIAFVLIYSVVGILRVLDSEKKYEREMEAYRESIRVLVEQDYDGVAALNTFTLKKGEDIIDTMFICKTDNDIIVGCVYVYGDQTEQYYEKMTDISIASLSEERSPLWHCSFPSKTSPNQINSCFYTVADDVPTEYYHLSTFEVNGQTVYFVITEIVPDTVVTSPD